MWNDGNSINKFTGYLDSSRLELLKDEAKKKRLTVQGCKMWTDGGIAAYLGLSPQHLSQLKGQKYAFLKKHAQKLSRVYRCTPAYLYGIGDRNQAEHEEAVRKAQRDDYDMLLVALKFAGYSINPAGRGAAQNDLYGGGIEIADSDGCPIATIEGHDLRVLADGLKNAIQAQTETVVDFIRWRSMADDFDVLTDDAD